MIFFYRMVAARDCQISMMACQNHIPHWTKFPKPQPSKLLQSLRILTPGKENFHLQWSGGAEESQRNRPNQSGTH